jgi:hypothetical protein
MAPSGRGELGVPTKGTFGFCARAFLGEYEGDSTSGNVVTLEDESNTSKKCWTTRGALYEKVYKTYDAKGKEFLQHTSARYPPLVPESDVEAEERRNQEKKNKAKRRRGGRIEAPLAQETRIDEEEKKKRIRHAVCRGLLFCPETSMYCDRDESSARAIAGLRVLKLRGLGRPSAFRRAQPTAMANNGLEAVDRRDAAGQ